MTDLRGKLNRLRDSQTVLPDEDRIEVSFDALCDVLWAGHEAADALEPFALAADDLDDTHRDRDSIWEAPAAMSITAGDLRKARAEITRLQSELGNQPRVRMCLPGEE